MLQPELYNDIRILAGLAVLASVGMLVQHVWFKFKKNKNTEG